MNWSDNLWSNCSGATTVNAYLPPGVWYKFDSNQTLRLLSNQTKSGRRLTLSTPIDEIVVAIRGGNILPAQQPQVTTTAQRDQAYQLVGVLDENGAASGSLYVDDGDSLDSESSGSYAVIEFSVNNHTLTVTPQKSGYVVIWSMFVIANVNLPTVSNVKLNGDTVRHSYENNVLRVDDFVISMTEHSSVLQWYA